MSALLVLVLRNVVLGRQLEVLEETLVRLVRLAVFEQGNDPRVAADRAHDVGEALRSEMVVAIAAGAVALNAPCRCRKRLADGHDTLNNILHVTALHNSR